MTKNLLKSARQALGDKNYEEALRCADEVLSIDGVSYNALVFRGLALTHLDRASDAASAYDAAIRQDGRNLLAWQGLLTLSEKTKDVPKYIDTASRIAGIALDEDDLPKCRQSIDKALAFANEHGTLGDRAAALRLILPGSPFFAPLEEQLDPPADTYEALAALLEEKEGREVSAAIAKGRQRLGVRLEDLTRQTNAEVLSRSQLPQVYAELINWSHEEGVRRAAEQKLLSHAHRYLAVCPGDEKAAQLRRVTDVARGMTLIKVANALAWEVELDWVDSALERQSLDALATYSRLFPESITSRAVALFLRGKHSPFDAERVAEQELDLGEKRHGSDEAIVDAVAQLGKGEGTILARRIVVRYLAEQQDHEAVIELGGTVAALLHGLQADTGLQLAQSVLENNLALAEALTFHEAPRFHARAMRLYQDVLAREADNSVASVGRARLMRMSGKARKSEAAASLQQVLDRDAVNQAALLELAVCQNALGQHGDALGTLDRLRALVDLDTPRPFQAQLHHQIGLAKEALDRPDVEIYAPFIQALKFDPACAAAYTELGKYYADRAGDVRRAEKCFQRALELSSREDEAARRLASSFADAREWDLVEIIAERTLQSDVHLPIAWPHLAVALVHAHFARWAQAIGAYQSALRIDGSSANAWLGLGEAYYNLGRLQAARKALGRAVDLGHSVHATLLLANTETALSEHESACARLQGLYEGLYESEKSQEALVDLCRARTAWAATLVADNDRVRAFEVLRDCLDGAVAALADATPELYEAIGTACLRLAALPGVEARAVAQLAALESGVHFTDGYKVELAPAQRTAARLQAIAAKAYSHGIDGGAVAWLRVAEALQQLNVAEAVQAAQRAVQSRPEDDAGWSCLGLLAARTPALSLAHHALAKACALNGKSARHYANLGLFYLRNDRTELANQCFSRAQTLDPDLPAPWAGQAEVANGLLEGKDRAEADELLAHAFALARPEQRPLTKAYAGIALAATGRRPPGEFRRLLRDALARMRLEDGGVSSSVYKSASANDQGDGGDGESEIDLDDLDDAVSTPGEQGEAEDWLEYHHLLMREQGDVPPRKDPDKNVIQAGAGSLTTELVNSAGSTKPSPAVAEVRQNGSVNGTAVAEREAAAAVADDAADGDAAAQDLAQAEIEQREAEQRAIEQQQREQRLALDTKLLARAAALADRLEAVYEDSESAKALARYCDAKALVGRLQLRCGQTEEAVESAELVLSLLDADDAENDAGGDQVHPSVRSCNELLRRARHAD